MPSSFPFSRSLSRPFSRSLVRPAGGDADALAYIAAVTATGVSPTAGQKGAINDFYVAAKADGYYTSLKRLYLPIWGVAAANAIDMIGLTSGTFVGGVTHAAGYVQGDGSTGYFDFGVSPVTAGLSLSSALVGCLCYSAIPNSQWIIGSTSSTPTNLGISATTGTSITTWNQIGGGTGVLTESLPARNGIILTNRTGLTSVTRDRRSASGYSTAVGSTTSATLGPPTGSVFAMARRADASALNFTTTQIGAFFMGFGISQPHSDLFTLALKNVWEGTTLLTLP